MFKRISLFMLLFTTFFGQVKSQTGGCFEIESILVDACAPQIIIAVIPIFNIPIWGQAEGYNEMIRFKIGPNDLNTADLNVIRWGNRNMPWQGLYGPNDSTAATVAALNATVSTPCGLLKEPVNGVLPANANVLLITSYAVSTVSNSFADLSDTLYVLFHNAKNTGGHFLNNNSNPDSLDLWQSPVIEFAGHCKDSVAYLMSSLVKSDGTIGQEDGARVNFTPDGVPTYLNNGCVALVNAASANWTNPGTISPNSGMLNLDSLVTGTPGGEWSGEGVENNQINPALWCGRTLNITYRVFNMVCNTIVEDTLTHSITISSNISAAWTAPSQLCSSSEPIQLTSLVTGTPGGTWAGDGVNNTIFNPNGLNGAVSVSYRVSDGTCEQTKSHTIMVIQEGDAAWQAPEAFCAGSGTIVLNQYVTGLQGGTWSGPGVSDSIFDPSMLSGTVNLTYISGIEPCADTVSHSVEILRIPTPDLPEAASYCTGTQASQIILPDTLGAIAKWYTDAALETLVHEGDTLNPGNTSSTYYAVWTIGNCASSADSTTVSFIPLPESPTGSTPQKYCPGASIPELSVQGTGQLVWFGSESLNDSLATGANYQPVTGPASFWVVSRDGGCQSNALRIDLMEDKLVEAHIAVDGPLVWCGSGTLVLRSDTASGNLWMPGNLQTQEMVVDTPGTYTLSVTGACNTAEAQVTLVDGTVHAAFTADPLQGDAPLVVNVSNQSQNQQNLTWLLNDEELNMPENNSFLISSEGLYELTQIAESEQGCRDTFSVEITVKETKVFLQVPNSFTPNSDNYNDVFKVKSSGLSQFKGTIFNRWGNKIYEWKDQLGGWDGMHNGSIAPNGVYYYIIEAKGKDGQSLEKKGDLTLIR